MIKKCVIVQFNLLFFCCCPHHPSPTQQNPTLVTHELSWQTHPPILSDCWTAGTAGQQGPLDTVDSPAGGHRGAGHTAGMCTGTGGGGHLGETGPVASFLSPLLHSFLQECLLANLRQQLWILRHVLFGRCDYFHRKNIFIDKTLSVVRGCFAGFFVWFASPWRELCLPPDL